MKSKILFLFTACILLFNSCKKAKEVAPEPPPPATTSFVACEPNTVFDPGTAAGARLIFKFVFDSTQARLDNLGNPSTVTAGNAAQSPKFNFMSQHYIELAGDTNPVGGGTILYNGTTTTVGGSSAIDYCSSIQTNQNVIFFSKPLSQITPGSYKWLRISLAYQNYNITYKANALPGNQLGSGTLGSFIGFKTYIAGYKINGTSYKPSVNSGGPGNHLQGYWAFQTSVAGQTYFADGQSAGSTTVPNPLFASSPIPAGSCLVTGQFVNNTMANSPLVITGSETTDIVITVSLSTNKSFEWKEVTADGYYQPEIGENVVDMGIRGLIPIKN
ncbi:MAG: hypothetical protein H0W84_03015 [Bacteroidetes bacterium]|nr:hypothetical protein [Bacteroidota bacterium]